MSLQQIHLGKQVQSQTLTFDAVATATARAILAVKPLDNYVQAATAVAVGAGASQVAITPALAGPFRYSDTTDFSDVGGRNVNLGIFAVRSTEDILTVANTNHKLKAKVLIENAADQTPIFDAAGKKIVGYLIVDQATAATTLKFYAEEADGSVVAATAFVGAASVSFQYDQRFNLDTLGTEALSNKKFFSGSADVNVIHDLQQLVKDLYGDLGYGFLNTGNGALTTSLLKQLQDHLNPAAPTAHPASDIQLSAITNLVDTNSQPVVDLQSAIAALFTKATTTEDALTAHMTDPQGAHDSSSIFFDGTGTNFLVPAVDVNNPYNQKDVNFALGALDTALKTEQTARLALQAEVDAVEAGAGLSTAGAYVANGATNFLAAATSLKNADELLDTALQAHKTSTTAHTANHIVVTPAGNLTATDAQAALVQLQTEIDTVNTAAAAAITEIHGIEAGSGLSVGTGAYIQDHSTNYLGSATSLVSADKALDTQMKVNTDAITAEVAARAAAITAEATARAAADAAIQTELDAVEAGAGLAANGNYVADATTNFLTAATSLKDADKKLDAQVKVNTDGLAAELAARAAAVAALQTELDATQAGAGLAVNGAYVADATTNYLTAATSLANADKTLDTALKATNDAAAALQNEVNTTQTGAGLNADGTYTADATTTYLTAATSLANADKKLDAAVKANADAIAALGTGSITALQTEVDAIETGAGLNADGTYTADATTNYLTAVTSLKGADKALDTQAKVNADAITAEAAARAAADTAEATARAAADAAIQAELDAAEAGAGLNTDGTYTADATTNFLTAATSLKNADKLLDAEINTTQATLTAESAARLAADNAEAAARATADAAIQTELNQTQVGAGLQGDGTYLADGSTNYLTAALSLKDADHKLDAQIKTNTTAIAALSSGPVTNLQNELDNVEFNAGFDANGNYIVNNASNYLTTATTLAGADNLLDAQIKTNADAIAAETTARTAADTAEATARANADTALQTEVDAIEAGAGLAANGTYAADVTTNYLTAATSLKDADKKLDTQIKAVADSIVATTSVNGTPVDSEILVLVHDNGTGEDYFVTAYEMVANCVPFLIINGLTHNSGDFTISNYTDGKRRKISFGTSSGLIAGDNAASWYRKV